MKKFHKIRLASELLDQIELFDYCSAIAELTRDTIPESYKHMEDWIISNYKVSVYDMDTIGKPSYCVMIRHLGIFQVF